MTGRVADFYNEKSVLITGAAGFIGTVLLEVLLRCCPGIRAVYLVLREKKGVAAEERKKIIFQKILFKNLRTEQPEVLDKVHVINGDCSNPNFGLSEEDLEVITSEVSIVFHIAAVISFTKTLRFTLNSNVMSVKYAVDLCRKMKKFDALVFTSTAYAHININKMKTNEEIVYRLPFRAQRIIDELQKDDDAILQHMLEMCGPPWPNHYTYSKCVAENYLMDAAGDMPIAIIRPSITLAYWKDPHTVKLYCFFLCPAFFSFIIERLLFQVFKCLTVARGQYRSVKVKFVIKWAKRVRRVVHALYQIYKPLHFAVDILN